MAGSRPDLDDSWQLGRVFHLTIVMDATMLHLAKIRRRKRAGADGIKQVAKSHQNLFLKFSYSSQMNTTK